MSEERFVGKYPVLFSISPDVDRDFVLFLTTLGRVSMTSAQVMLEADDAIAFKDVLWPENCVLEWAHAEKTAYEKRLVRLTFKFQPKAGGAR